MRKVLMIFSILMLAVWSAPAVADDCIDIELGAEVISNDPYDILNLYFYAINCGTERGMATFTVTLEKDSELIGSAEITFNMPADVPFEKEIRLPILDIVPPGTYTLCVTAVLGEASDTACASITLDVDNNVTSFTPLEPVATEDKSWGDIKKTYR